MIEIRLISMMIVMMMIVIMVMIMIMMMSNDYVYDGITMTKKIIMMSSE
jgi:hypothetical protein